MMNLFEMMQTAQNGQAMQNLARQFGLSQQQAQAAVEALLPAFSMGLQRQTHDPYAFGNLAQLMTASPFGRIYDADGDGIPDNAQTLGNNVLGQLFGSKDVSNAIAAQAAATTGLGQAILKQMLPVIAAMLMGGLVKSTSNQGLGGILGQFAEMMQGKSPGQPPSSRQPQGQANPLDAILSGMFGQPPGPGHAPVGPGGTRMPGGRASDNPMGDMLGQILGGMFGRPLPTEQDAPSSQRPEPPEAEAQRPHASDGPASPPGPGTPGSLGLDALNQMFEHGRKVQDQHQDAMKSILDAMLGGGRR